MRDDVVLTPREAASILRRMVPAFPCNDTLLRLGRALLMGAAALDRDSVPDAAASPAPRNDGG